MQKSHQLSFVLHLVDGAPAQGTSNFNPHSQLSGRQTCEALTSAVVANRKLSLSKFQVQGSAGTAQQPTPSFLAIVSVPAFFDGFLAIVANPNLLLAAGRTAASRLQYGFLPRWAYLWPGTFKVHPQRRKGSLVRGGAILKNAMVHHKNPQRPPGCRKAEKSRSETAIANKWSTTLGASTTSVGSSCLGAIGATSLCLGAFDCTRSGIQLGSVDTNLRQSVAHKSNVRRLQP